MPDEEHELTIRIETNAGDAAKDMERLDEAQQNVRQSGEKLQETERRGSSAEARKKKQRKREAEAAAKDLVTERKNTEKLNKTQAKVRHGLSASRVSIKSLAHALGGTTLVAGIAAVAAGLGAVKKGLDFIRSGTKNALSYKVTEEATGESTETIQALEHVVSKFGGDRESAVQGLAALKQNMELTAMGRYPFSDVVQELMGDYLRIRPGASFEEYSAQLGEGFRRLSEIEAQLAGREMGLPSSWILAMRNGDFLTQLEEGRKRSYIDKKTVQKSADVNQRLEDTTRAGKSLASQIWVTVGDMLLPRDTTPSGLTTELLQYLNRGPAYLQQKVFFQGVKTVDDLLKKFDRQQKKSGNPVELDPEIKRWQNIIRESKDDPFFGAFNTATPLNGMGQQAAFAAGYRAGLSSITNNNGGNTVTTGDIIINAPSGDAPAIAQEVGAVLDSFANLDRLNATQYYV